MINGKCAHPIGPLPPMKTSVSRTASLKGDLEWSTLPCVWHWWTKLSMWALESLRGIMSRMAHEETRGRCGLRRNSRKTRSYKGGADRSRDWKILYMSKYTEVTLCTDGRVFDLNWQEEHATHAKRFKLFSRGAFVVCDGFQILWTCAMEPRRRPVKDGMMTAGMTA